MVTVGLYVRLEARAGHEMDVENLLKEALQLVDEEPQTVAWYALRLGPSTFGIFDAFPDESGREEHLNGRVAQALNARADQILADPPKIERADILAAKVPVAAAHE
jgi:quinol monooxygenase YgiN